MNPILMILDLDLIKNIMVKDFNVFPNRKLYFNEKDDPLTAHLVNLEDDEWRSLRTKLTPTFTSGKLKMMLPTILKITENLINTLEKEVVMNESVEIKELLSRYTVDVIGNYKNIHDRPMLNCSLS
jgi:cytochrome P450 family 6